MDRAPNSPGSWPRFCLGCGGPNPHATGSHACSYCGGPLVPLGTADPRSAVRCSSCATSVSAGASFCPQCGTALAAIGGATASVPCPGCTATLERSGGGSAPTMVRWGLMPTPQRPAGHTVLSCERCGGVWADPETLQAVTHAAAEDAPPPGTGARVKRRQMARGSLSAPIVYRKCVECGQRMLRRNFARISGVIVDQCGRHGTFFDAGELEDVLAFIRSGGLRAAHRTETDERARELRHSANMARAMQTPEMGGLAMAGYDPRADVGVAFLRWAGRWIRNGFR